MKLYCKKDYYLDHWLERKEKVFLKGRVYYGEFTLGSDLKINDIIIMTNDERGIHFGIEKSNKKSYYKDFFNTEIDMRKRKLRKLNKSWLNFFK